MSAKESVGLTKKDFATDQIVRWCPGCGDYAILNAVQQVFPTLGIPREKFAIVSGIGCSSRFPYYMNTYGFHSIHGRAPAIATGVKVANPDLSVWVITGDGDALSIGGNHFIHTMRRNVGLKILLFNNKIYGLTKGQYSPTSEKGKKTKSTPFGSVDRPFNPISLALGAECTFVARTVDIYQKHMKEVLTRAAAHKGTAFVEILQNCNIFNDRAFADITDKPNRDDKQVVLEQGKPLIYGKEHRRGIRMSKYLPEVVDLDGSVSEDELVVHDETRPAAYAFLLSRMLAPEFPTPIGIFRAIDTDSYEDGVNDQVRSVTEKLGEGTIESLLNAGDTWTVT
ncbi:MAG: 2-oxoacid:ferredoxin oxidoreductase subunit beta [Acidobacteria bacterium]|nr:2-oxoacid:ferredoxin oxidoreductase subunit beta [Acidobacteriota bacterium]